MNARKVWLATHRWLGIVLGPLLVLVGLTGSSLVFDHALDEWLNPELLMARGEAPAASLTEITAAAETAFNADVPSAERQAVTSLSSPRVAGGVWTVWFTTEEASGPAFTAVYVDPTTTEVTGQRVWGRDLMSWLYRLHFRLLSGSVGATIVGGLGLLMLVSVVTGLIVWWPLWRHSWRAALAIRPGRRRLYDLHKTVGVFSMLFLTVIAATGVALEFPNALTAVTGLFSPRSEPSDPASSNDGSDGKRITPEEAIAIAQTHYPQAKFCHFHPPNEDDAVYEIALRQADEVQRSYGRTQLFIDPYSGRVVATRIPEHDTAADKIALWQFPLHNGEVFGLLGRWIVFFAGLTPAILYVSGMIVWWRKRGAAVRRKNLKTNVSDVEPRDVHSNEIAAAVPSRPPKRIKIAQ